MAAARELWRNLFEKKTIDPPFKNGPRGCRCQETRPRAGSSVTEAKPIGDREFSAPLPRGCGNFSALLPRGCGNSLASTYVVANTPVICTSRTAPWLVLLVLSEPDISAYQGKYVLISPPNGVYSPGSPLRISQEANRSVESINAIQN
jgi:hypothetical protein